MRVLFGIESHAALDRDLLSLLIPGNLDSGRLHRLFHTLAAFNTVRLHCQTPILMPACQAGRQFVQAFQGKSLICHSVWIWMLLRNLRSVYCWQFISMQLITKNLMLYIPQIYMEISRFCYMYCYLLWTSSSVADINECAVEPCENGGFCSDGLASFTCDCAPGYAGPSCQTGKDKDRKHGHQMPNRY